jgi:hypothetical protein
MTTTHRSLCVLCGAQAGNDPAYVHAAADLGRLAAKARLRVVYGGGAQGMMGALAAAALDGGGEVIGVMPRFLREREPTQEGLTKLILTETLTERKMIMTQLAEAIAALPGGFGTVDELTEILSWRHLSIIAKPIIIVDIKSFWAPFFALVDHEVKTGFSPTTIKANYKIVKDVGDVLRAAQLVK